MTKPIEPSVPHLIHATCVVVGDKAVLIIGPSGSGKSSLALQLMAYGAELVADDRVELTLEAGEVWARKPKTLPAMIEARGVGLLNAKVTPARRIALVVDMAKTSEDRMPEAHSREILGHPLTCFDKVDAGHFPAAVLHYLKGDAETG